MIDNSGEINKSFELWEIQALSTPKPNKIKES
jgi:hypothetical protein